MTKPNFYGLTGQVEMIKRQVCNAVQKAMETQQPALNQNQAQTTGLEQAHKQKRSIKR